MRTCKVRVYRDLNDMNGSHEAHNIIGIRLIPDGGVVQIDNRNLSYQDGIIGSIICSDLSMLVQDFRDLLIAKLSDLPEEFRFLSKNGFPIESTEEAKIEVLEIINYNLITVQRHFGIPRIGVKWLHGESLGFIFINFKSSLTEVRKVVETELGEKIEDASFQFVDKKAWPVSDSQERKLTAWDVCVEEHYFNITKVSIKRKLGISNNKIKRRPSKLNNSTPSYNLNQSSNIQTHSNSILISYVHGEATTHARDLKDELVNMGLESVFLDVDDIPAGQDWQDVINTALYNCTAFVALVTPRYGETRWTNREAKLADDKEKLIIPVSFLEKWPPDQLAIQFLSLQYIPWKTADEFASAEGSCAFDITHWDQRCIHRVAKEIKKLCTEQDVSTPDSASIIDSRPVNESPRDMFAATLKHGSCKEDNIVISAHAQEKDFVEKLVSILKEEGYNVWSSTDVTESYGSFDDSQQSEYSPVMESYSHTKSFSNENLNISRQNSICNFKSDCGGDDSLQCSQSEFKRKVQAAKLVILIISETYNKCRLCLQQAFYCEQRRRVVAIKYGEFQIDNHILNLYSEQDILQNDDENELFSNVKQEVAKKLKENTSLCDRIQIEVMNLKQQINSENCVYVIGGTNCVSQNAELFSVALGNELAKINGLTLVTEGFFGAGDFVGKNFCEEREILAKGKPQRIYHVIPHRDRQDFTKRARQKDDGSFEKIPYGQTIFYGNSVSERDEIVSATFKICILIEGGERSARLAEKFLWNDCTVIPVLFNNRAIKDRRCLFACISKVPCGVHSDDWCGLNNSKKNPDEIARMVRKIVYTLLRIRSKERKNFALKNQLHSKN